MPKSNPVAKNRNHLESNVDYMGKFVINRVFVFCFVHRTCQLLPLVVPTIIRRISGELAPSPRQTCQAIVICMLLYVVPYRVRSTQLSADLFVCIIRTSSDGTALPAHGSLCDRGKPYKPKPRKGRHSFILKVNLPVGFSTFGK